MGDTTDSPAERMLFRYDLVEKDDRAYFYRNGLRVEVIPPEP